MIVGFPHPQSHSLGKILILNIIKLRQGKACSRCQQQGGDPKVKKKTKTRELERKLGRPESFGMDRPQERLAPHQGSGASSHSLQKVFCSCSHPHGFQDLLVQGSPLILQSAPASLCKGIATLRENERGPFRGQPL